MNKIIEILPSEQDIHVECQNRLDLLPTCYDKNTYELAFHQSYNYILSQVFKSDYFKRKKRATEKQNMANLHLQKIHQSYLSMEKDITIGEYAWEQYRMVKNLNDEPIKQGMGLQGKIKNIVKHKFDTTLLVEFDLNSTLRYVPIEYVTHEIRLKDYIHPLKK